jgi:hypothetical protein
MPPATPPINAVGKTSPPTTTLSVVAGADCETKEVPVMLELELVNEEVTAVTGTNVPVVNNALERTVDWLVVPSGGVGAAVGFGVGNVATIDIVATGVGAGVGAGIGAGVGTGVGVDV